MDDYSELALESAEGVFGGREIREKRLSSRLSRLSFRVKTPLGTGEKEKEEKYHTLLMRENPLENRALQAELTAALASSVAALAGRKRKKVLAVGLGNPSAVVDALGAETIKLLSAGEKAGGYLATLTPSVFGVTGLETFSVVKGVAKEYNPDLILCVDTLATRRAERLYRAVQIGAGGIAPGGGVGNRRVALSEESLGIPVLSVGVPLLAHADRCSSLPAGLVVTPKEIDLLVPLFADILARGVQKALEK